MDDRDLELRNLTYRRFVDLGRAPTAAEVAAAAHATEGEVTASWATPPRRPRAGAQQRGRDLDG